MKLFKYNILALLSGVFLLFLLAACAPEVGSDGWCKNMKEKPKADWTANEAKNFATHCILK